MNIEKLLSTKERVELLRRIIYSTGELTVSGLARNARVSKGLASMYMGSLVREGVLKRLNGRFIVQDGLGTRALRILLNLSSLDRRLFRKFRFVRAAGVYGSFARGDNTERSDIDIWILVDDAEEEKLAALTSELMGTLGNVRPLYLTEKKVRLLRMNDTVFYHSLAFGSINIFGGGIETV